MTIQRKTLEDALAEICELHDLTSCSLNINLKQRDNFRFSAHVHWDGYSESTISCQSGSGTTIQHALALAIQRANTDRKICAPVDALPSFEVENPQAFPGADNHPAFVAPIHHFGMSLRDYFAGQAPEMTDQWYSDSPKSEHFVNRQAAWAYFFADAMLAARNGGQS